MEKVQRGEEDKEYNKLSSGLNRPAGQKGNVPSVTCLSVSFLLSQSLSLSA